MTEWTIDITSKPGALPTDRDPADVLDELAAAIEANPAALGPSVSANTAHGTLSSVYQVDAASFFDAMHLGQSIFIAALAAAALPAGVGAYEQHPADPAAA